MANQQRWFGVCESTSAVAATWLPVNGRLNSATTFLLSAGLLPANGTIKAIYVKLSAAPGAGKSRQYQLDINGTPSGTLTLTISDASTTGEIVADVAVSAGDLLSIKTTPSGTPTGAISKVTVVFEPTTTEQFAYPSFMGNLGATAGDGPYFSPLLWGNDVAGLPTTNTVGGTQCTSPIAGTIKAFFVNLTAAPGVGNSWALEILKNGALEATSTITITNPNTTGNLTSLGISVAVGDILTFRATGTSVPASARIRFGVILEPTTAGQYIAGGNSTGSTNTGAVNYVGATGQAANATEATVSTPINVACELVAIAASIATAPGAAKTWTYTSRINALDGGLTFAISGAATTTGNDTSPADALGASALVALSITPAGTPTAQAGHNWAFGFGPVPTPGGTGSLIRVANAGTVAQAAWADGISDVLPAPTVSVPSTGQTLTIVRG